MPMPDNQVQTRTLSPTLQDLQNVEGISNLIKSIERFIDPKRPQNGPNNVAYVYLAFCQSLESQGIASINTMPSFDFFFGGQTHTVIVTEDARAKSGSDIAMKVRSSSTERKKGLSAKNSLSLRKEMFKKRVQQAAESHIFQIVQTGQVSQGQVQAEDMLSLEGIDSIIPQSPSGERLLDILRNVMKLETTSEEVSSRVACEYFKLGKEYVDYIHFKEKNPPPVHSQSFHRVALPHLAQITKAITRSSLTHVALLKRLERARKVWLLVNLFGKEILGAKSIANISFLDKVPFTVFGDLATSTTETNFITEMKTLFL